MVSARRRNPNMAVSHPSPGLTMNPRAVATSPVNGVASSSNGSAMNDAQHSSHEAHPSSSARLKRRVDDDDTTYRR